ncbi:hypothetical protein DA89_133 [Vibrio paracholerae]|nr:hypothetical protein DA89_133 [Vibrio paracholerae]
MPVVLQTVSIITHTEAHLRRFTLYANLIHHFDEIRIGSVVINDKARIHCVRLTRKLNIHRRSVPANVVIGFE